ncbi:MAG: hypothetical protein QOJ20_1590 [Mycobacterium sp.]|nr:hypothetical protein [Mycobacterium sp.]
MRLRSRSVARARGDEATYRDLANRYRAIATSLDFEGHISGPRRWRDRGGSCRRPEEALKTLSCPAFVVRIGDRCTGSPASTRNQYRFK